MTITEQDIEFFKEAKRIQELWEPKVGDWAIYWKLAREPLVIGSLDSKGKQAWLGGKECGGFADLDLLTWLPRLDQLIEMLKEQGWWVAGLHERPDGSWYVEVGRKPKEFEWAECKVAEGPTPSIALGKCLLEVLKEE